MTRLEILKNSLEKKQAKFNEKLNEHFVEVRRANGQPLNDKRNGAATFRRWERQNNALAAMQAEIEKTTAAITREEGKLMSIAYNRDSMPQEIRQLIKNGTLKQWGKYPHIMFVDGVDKARIIWDDKKKQVMHKYTNKLTDKEQWKKFAQVYNYIAEAVNKRKNNPPHGTTERR